MVYVACLRVKASLLLIELMSRDVIGFSVVVYSHSHLRSTRISSIYANCVQSTWRTSRVLTSTLKRNVIRRTSWWEDAAFLCGLHNPQWLCAKLRKGFTVLFSVRLLANMQKNAVCHWKPCQKMHFWINHRQSTSNKDIMLDILYQLWLILIFCLVLFILLFLCVLQEKQEENELRALPLPSPAQLRALDCAVLEAAEVHGISEEDFALRQTVVLRMEGIIRKQLTGTRLSLPNLRHALHLFCSLSSISELTKYARNWPALWYLLS